VNGIKNVIARLTFISLPEIPQRRPELYNANPSSKAHQWEIYRVLKSQANHESNRTHITGVGRKTELRCLSVCVFYILSVYMLRK
jgi:hypothetical protein